MDRREQGLQAAFSAPDQVAPATERAHRLDQVGIGGAGDRELIGQAASVAVGNAFARMLRQRHADHEKAVRHG